jgi:hypothetical protein
MPDVSLATWHCNTLLLRREQEAALKESLESHAVKDNLWESVVELVDLQSKEGATDISRMRQTMLAMKNE